MIRKIQKLYYLIGVSQFKVRRAPELHVIRRVLVEIPLFLVFPRFSLKSGTGVQILYIKNKLRCSGRVILVVYAERDYYVLKKETVT